eukprot:jgi/Galph1/6055/GphlegSOOS_G4660.1
MFRALKNALSQATNLYETTTNNTSPFKNQENVTFLEGTKLLFGQRQVQVGELLAEGGFSFVYLATDQVRNVFALKCTLCLDKESLQSALREVEVFESLAPHPNIIQFYGSQVRKLDSERTQVFVLLELCEGKSLADAVFTLKKDNWLESEILQVFRDCCRAVRHLHQHTPPISHRDIKLENFLKSNVDSCFKLCDFGSCHFSSAAINSRKERFEQEYILQKQSTYLYRAPEMVDLYGNKELTEKVDIWALGCILYILCYKRHPFETGSAVRILNSRVDVPQSPQYSPEVINLMLDMLRVNPRERPSAQMVIEKLDSLMGEPSRNSQKDDNQYQQLEPLITSIEEDWASFTSNIKEERVTEEQLIKLDSPSLSSAKQQHILDAL